MSSLKGHIRKDKKAHCMIKISSSCFKLISLVNKQKEKTHGLKDLLTSQIVDWHSGFKMAAVVFLW